MKQPIQNTLKILVVEDNTSTILFLTKFLQKQGHNTLLAEDGRTAVQLFSSEQPDLVLTDINMPGINGLEAIKQMRNIQTNLWIPIIILSAYDQEHEIVEGLKAGADDYMTKPVNLNILNAKIQSMERFVQLQKTNLQTTLKLSLVNQQLEMEQQLAKRLFDKMLNMGNLNYPGFQYWSYPSAQFSGDLIAATHTTGDKLYLMLADATGHGLSAALPTLIIARTFYAMSIKGYSLSSILAEINHNSKNFLPTGYFVAAALFAINFNHQTIEYWNGGLPDALLIDAEGKVLHTLTSDNLAMGILDDEQFNAKTELITWRKPCELITYSDGLTESCNPLNESFGERRMLHILQSQPMGERIHALKQAIIGHIQANSGQDDISVLTLLLNSAHVSQQ